MKRKHYTQEQNEAILARYAVSTKQLKDFLIDEGVPKSTFTQWLPGDLIFHSDRRTISDAISVRKRTQRVREELY